MPAANTKAVLETAMKYVVENDLKFLMPNTAKLQEKAPMKEIGRDYLMPVALTFELGITFGSTDAFNYNASIAGVYDEAVIDPNPVVLRSQWGFEGADRTVSKGKKAVISQVSLRTTQMKKSLMKVLEIESLFGRSAVGIGVVGAVDDTSGTNVLTITDATFAPGIWGGFEGVLLDCYNSTTTKRNSNADLEVSAIDFDNKQVTVTGNATDTAAIQVGDRLLFKGAYSASQLGLFYQLDTSGSVFGIDNTAYALWKGIEHNVNGALTMAEVLKGAAKAVGRGGLDEDADLYVSPETFEALNATLAGYRQLDSSYKSSKVELGAGMIKYHAQFGTITIVPHLFMMPGYAMLIPPSQLCKVGATDVTFGIPGKDGDHIEALEGSYAYQMVARASWQMFLKCPAKAVLYKGIVNP